MEFTINQTNKCEIFSGIFHNLRTFVDNINIQFSNQGIHLQTMDNSRVSVFELNIPAKWFDQYLCELEDGIVLGISSNIASKILNARDKEQHIKFTYENSNRDHLYVEFSTENKTKTIFDKNFEMPLVDMDEETLQIPEIDYTAEFSLNSSVFSSLINQLKTFGETVEISCSEENITLHSHSVDSGKMSVEIKNDDLSEFSIVEDESLNLSFSLHYLHSICMYQKISKEISIYLCDNYPLKIAYDLGEQAYIHFYLAPKMNDD